MNNNSKQNKTAAKKKYNINHLLHKVRVIIKGIMKKKMSQRRTMNNPIQLTGNKLRDKLINLRLNWTNMIMKTTSQSLSMSNSMLVMVLFMNSKRCKSTSASQTQLRRSEYQMIAKKMRLFLILNLMVMQPKKKRMESMNLNLDPSRVTSFQMTTMT